MSSEKEIETAVRDFLLSITSDTLIGKDREVREKSRALLEDISRAEKSAVKAEKIARSIRESIEKVVEGYVGLKQAILLQDFLNGLSPSVRDLIIYWKEENSRVKEEIKNCVYRVYEERTLILHKALFLLPYFYPVTTVKTLAVVGRKYSRIRDFFEPMKALGVMRQNFSVKLPDRIVASLTDDQLCNLLNFAVSSLNYLHTSTPIIEMNTLTLQSRVTAKAVVSPEEGELLVKRFKIYRKSIAPRFSNGLKTVLELRRLANQGAEDQKMEELNRVLRHLYKIKDRIPAEELVNLILLVGFPDALSADGTSSTEAYLSNYPLSEETLTLIAQNFTEQ